MKKIILSIYFIAGLLIWGQAQTVTTTPSSFTALDPVTVTIDVTGTGAEGLEEAYIWGWSPGVGDWQTNGEWGNSSPAAQLTKVSDNIWEFSLPLEADGVTYNNFSELLNAQPGRITQVGCLVKEKVGSDETKTPDILIDVESLVFTPSQLRVFPSVARTTDVVTLYLDTNAEDLTEIALKGTRSATLWVEEPVTGTTISIPATEQQEGVWGASLFPSQAFGEEITRINFWFEDADNPGLISDKKEFQFVQ